MEWLKNGVAPSTGKPASFLHASQNQPASEWPDPPIRAALMLGLIVAVHF